MIRSDALHPLYDASVRQCDCAVCGVYPQVQLLPNMFRALLYRHEKGEELAAYRRITRTWFHSQMVSLAQ
jgi:hypothetical protein